MLNGTRSPGDCFPVVYCVFRTSVFFPQKFHDEGFMRDNAKPYKFIELSESSPELGIEVLWTGGSEQIYRDRQLKVKSKKMIAQSSNLIGTV